MKKYKVYGLITASVVMGEYEAESKEQAIKMSENDDQAEWFPSLCHQCAREIELNDITTLEAEEIE